MWIGWWFLYVHDILVTLFCFETLGSMEWILFLRWKIYGIICAIMLWFAVKCDSRWILCGDMLLFLIIEWSMCYQNYCFFERPPLYLGKVKYIFICFLIWWLYRDKIDLHGIYVSCLFFFFFGIREGLKPQQQIETLQCPIARIGHPYLIMPDLIF